MGLGRAIKPSLIDDAEYLTLYPHRVLISPVAAMPSLVILEFLVPTNSQEQEVKDQEKDIHILFSS